MDHKFKANTNRFMKWCGGRQDNLFPACLFTTSPAASITMALADMYLIQNYLSYLPD